MRRGEGAGTAHARARARGRRGAGRGEGRLHPGRARRVRQRRGAEADGRARRLLRPNIGLVLQNYIENKPKFLGIGNYTEEGFAVHGEGACRPTTRCSSARWRRKVKMPMGTDAVAGAHGQNARELVARVQGRRPEPDGRDRSARRRSPPNRWGSSKQIGSLAAGLQADIVAVDGNPLQDITALRRVLVRDEGRQSLQALGATTGTEVRDKSTAPRG